MNESAPLHVRLLWLSLAAGCVDAIAFVHAGVFPANMTGNSVVLALALARVTVEGGLLLPALALAGFCVGAAVGARIVHGKPAAWSPYVSRAIMAAGVLLLLSAGMAAFGTGISPLIVLAAVAMGLQSAAAQHLGVPGVATVVVTGTLTAAITHLVGPPACPGKSATPSSRHLPAGSWLAYLGGAIIGGLQSAPHLSALIFLPGVVLAGVSLARRKSA